MEEDARGRSARMLSRLHSQHLAVFLLSQVLFFKSFVLILKVYHSQSELFLFLDVVLIKVLEINAPLINAK